MKALAACLVVAAGCFNPTYHDPACGPDGECPSGLSCYAGTCLSSAPSDAQLDGDIDAPDGRPIDAAPTCVGSGEWELCFTGAAPSTPVTLNTQAIVTDTSTRCATDIHWTSPGQPDVCVIAGATISVTGTVIATGNKPLVLVATDTITITGTLDVASHHSGFSSTGAGSQPSSCMAFAQTPTSSTVGAGAGAGGSFMTKGGDGGAGGNGAPAGLAASANATAPTNLRGGCDGETGADAAASSAGAGGKGGGAVYVVAGGSIALNGTINASGAGGFHALAIAGGGGAGSGGMIVLYSPSITSSAGKMMANGGGGGGGGGGNVGIDGSDPSQPLTPALGGQSGAGNGCGGNTDGTGGSGAASSFLAGSGTAGATSNSCGGGGGGGGIGYIRSNVAITGLTASPAVSVVP